jgi:tRNA nucleotidyltransferase (CCA-adding enzyme)
MIRRPAMQDLSGELASAARGIAARLAGKNLRAWIVGGAVRDLALGRTPKDVDLCSAALPDEIERLFPGTVPLGKAFGTILILHEGTPVEHTTFRSEFGYSDRRRPDHVVFGANVEEDSARRDFTCNALYLDPLLDQHSDPQGGLEDLQRGWLRCVGDARARFGEDGLRLVRLARFAGALGLEPAPGVLDAATASADALEGVAPERVLREFERIFDRPGHARALEILLRAGLLGRLFEGFELSEERLSAFGRLPSEPGLACGLALLFGAEPRRESTRLESLRVSRDTRQLVLDIWDCLDGLASLDRARRSQRVRLERRPGFDAALRIAAARGFDTALIDELAAEKRALGADGLAPAAWLRSKDLELAGLPKGPRWGELLAAAETAQLDGAIQNHPDALAWLRAQLAQDGGKT